MRKHKALTTLQYAAITAFTDGITINGTMMEGRSDEFILSELWDTVICLDDADHHERGGYTVNLQSGNYENDLQAAEDGALTFGHDIPLITGSVTTDVNGERHWSEPG